MDPCSTHALHNRGISYDKIGETKRAQADFQRVLELNDNIKRERKGGVDDNGDSISEQSNRNLSTSFR